MLEFSTRGDYGSRSLDSYAAIFKNQDLSTPSPRRSRSPS